MLPRDRALRVLAVASLVNTVGTGLLVSTLVLYFTTIQGLSGGHVGLALTLGGAVGMAASIPLGHLADVRGARGVLLALCVAQAVATAGYLLADSFTTFLVVALVAVALERTTSAVRQGVIARALPVEGRIEARAYLRSVTNVGFGVGSGLATAGIAIGTRTGYEAMIAIDALSFLGVAAVLTRLPRLPRVPPAETGPRLAVLRDRQFLALMALLAVLGVPMAILDVGLPLWVGGHTDAPEALVGIVFVMNCVLVAAFSVRVARGTDAPPDAARSVLRSAVAILACCALLAGSAGLGAAAAAAVIVAAMLFQVLGEMLFAAGEWSLAFALAPAERQGQYQAVAATSFAFALMIGPLVMAGVVAAGTAGWLAFGVVMLASGAAAPALTRWAVRDRVLS